MAVVPEHYATTLPLRDKITFVLSLMQKANPAEVAIEIMELQGIASEEGVAETTKEITEELHKLHQEGAVALLSEPGEKARYRLTAIRKA